MMTEYKIKEILRFHNGRGYDSISEHGLIPVYGSGGVMGYTDKSLLEGEYILLPRKGSLNNYFYINKPFWNVDTIYAADVMKDDIDCKYLYYYFKCLNLGNLDSGSTLPSMTQSAYGSIKVKLPSCDTQKTVAKFLTTIDDKISVNNKIIETSEKLMREIYDYWFVQFDFPDENGHPYKSSGGEMVYNETLKREIPKGWITKELGEIIIEAKKSSVQVSEARERTGVYPFFTSGDEIIDFEDYYVDGFNIFLNTGGNADVKSYYGKSAYSTDTWCISAKNYSFMLTIFLSSIKTYLNDNCFAGSGLKHLQKIIFKQIKIVVPDTKTLGTFNSIASSIYEDISACQIENKKLASLRDWLLPMLMNGQARIIE